MHPRVTLAARRTAAVGGALALTLSLGSSAALAGGPDRVFLPAPDFIELAAGDVCSFPVRIDFLENREYGMTFTSASGAQYMLVDGYLVTRETNLATGRSVVDNVSGPGRFDFNADGTTKITFYGNGLIWWAGHLIRSSGRQTELLDANGQLLWISEHGHIDNLCDSLA